MVSFFKDTPVDTKNKIKFISGMLINVWTSYGSSFSKFYFYKSYNNKSYFVYHFMTSYLNVAKSEKNSVK